MYLPIQFELRPLRKNWGHTVKLTIICYLLATYPTGDIIAKSDVDIMNSSNKTVKAQSNTHKHSGGRPYAVGHSTTNRVSKEHWLKRLDRLSDKAYKAHGQRTIRRRSENSSNTHCLSPVYTRTTERQYQEGLDQNWQTCASVTPVPSWMSCPCQALRAWLNSQTTKNSHRSVFWPFENDWRWHRTNAYQTWPSVQSWNQDIYCKVHLDQAHLT